MNDSMTSSGAAAIRGAVARVNDGAAPIRDALLEISAADVEQVLHRQFDGSGSLIAVGIGASPGAAVGVVCFSPDDAVEVYDGGADVILVKDETSPEDVHGMAIAEGILTSRGGMASHAAVVARGWGKPAVCGADAITIGADSFAVGDLVISAGDVISLDGATGEVFIGAVESGADHDEAFPELDQLLGWADQVRAGRLGVRANADNADDARKAREFGAEGIGLCRTEHQFLGDRLPLIRSYILASNQTEEADAAALLEQRQKEDYLTLLRAMDSLPVTVRLLDPPLHEFLPPLEELIVAAARQELDQDGQLLLSAARQWHETNPMLGTRGVRLAILRDGLYHVQVRALLQAADELDRAGGTPRVEIMVPLIVDRRELDVVRVWIDQEIDAVNHQRATPLDVTVGTMIETPRAALTAADVAGSADFFSFGTNDLTQMTFGFSRDDVEARIVPEYLHRGLLDANPFETIDPHGVGRLLADAVTAGRQTNPDLKVGICGEHGGEPASIELCYRAGLDYVSCSPYRVPIARLAAAQAVIRTEQEAAES